MKNRTKLLAYLQDNIKSPDHVHYYNISETIILTFQDEDVKEVACLSIKLIDDKQVTINLSLARKIESIYKDLPALARANDFVKLIENFQANSFSL